MVECRQALNQRRPAGQTGGVPLVFHASKNPSRDVRGAVSNDESMLTAC